MRAILCGATALVAVWTLPQPSLAADSRPLVTTQPDPQADVAPFFIADSDPRWSGADWSADDIAGLRKKVKYVFVIFNENRSFDHEYGTFPGVDGLYSDGKKPRAPADTPGFTQTYLDTVTGQTVTVQPFLVGPHENASFKDSTDHSHKGLAAKIDVEMKDGVPTQDGQVRRSRVAKIRRNRQREGREAGDAVRPPRHGAYGLRHDPVLLALRQPLHHLRQHFRHRGHALDPERSRDHRRTIRRNAVGEAPGKPDERRPTPASPAPSPARSTASPTPARRPRRGRRWSTIRSPGGARRSTTRLAGRRADVAARELGVRATPPRT